VVAGPYVSRQVSSTVFDHASIPASVLLQHEADAINTRDAASADWWSLLDADRLVAGTPEAPIAMPAMVVDEAVIYADECRGSPLHRPLGASLTGQPELEQLFDDRYPNHPKDGRRDQATTWLKVLEHARRLGVVR
jgi:hypothetical protein